MIRKSQVKIKEETLHERTKYNIQLVLCQIRSKLPHNMLINIMYATRKMASGLLKYEINYLIQLHLVVMYKFITFITESHHFTKGLKAMFQKNFSKHMTKNQTCQDLNSIMIAAYTGGITSEHPSEAKIKALQKGVHVCHDMESKRSFWKEIT